MPSLHFDQKRYDLFAASVMPDHVHILFQPWPKPAAKEDELIFWSLAELMHSIKSFTAREINRAENSQGKQLWENEYHDRLMRSDHDVEEKFLYLCRNPWTENLVRSDEDYPWVWEWSRRGDPAGSMPARASNMLALPSLPWNRALRKIRKRNAKGSASMLLAEAGMLPAFKYRATSHSNFTTPMAFLLISQN